MGSTPANAASAQASYGQMTRSRLGATRTLGHGQHAAYATQASVERKLSARRMLGEACARELVRCREQRQGDRQIEPRALLLQLRRRKIDREPIARPLQLRGDDPAADSLLRLLTGAIGEPDDRQRGHLAALDVRLDLHPPGLETDKGKGDRAREHAPRLRGQL